MSCTATVRNVGDVTIIDLSGNFTIADSPGLMRGKVADALESGSRKIILNLADVTYMDSAGGIGELIGSYTRAVRQGAQLKLLNAGKNISYVLRLTHLHTVFDIHDDEGTAIKSF